MFDISVNGKVQVTLTERDAEGLDVIQVSENAYHLIHGNRSHVARLVAYDQETKSVVLEIEGSVYEVKIRDDYDLLVRRMGLSASVVHKINEVKAPMPGLVLKVIAEPGRTVKEGDPLLILEAMKMENVIKSAGDGVVKQIVVKEGQAVDKGTLLIEME